MKIAIFTDTFPPQVNGVARTLKRLEEYLIENEIEHQFYAPDTKGDDLFSNSIHRFKSIPFFLYPECRIALPNMVKIRKQLESFQPDLLHIATPFNIGLTGLYYGKKLNIPMVGSYHTHFDQYLQYYDLDFLSNWLWNYLSWFHRSFRKNFVPSQETKLELANRGFANLKIWSRGVECEQFHPNFEINKLKERYEIKTPYILTYVGRLAPEKDLRLLLEIAANLPQHIKEKVHWLIVGDGPMKQEIQNKKIENMTLTGYLTGDTLAEVYACSTLFVFPSSTETFGNVVLESLASGTPAIVARAGGVKETIKDRVTGMLCEPGNVNEFVLNITDVLENQALLQKMEREARNYAQSQTWNRIFDELVLEYEKVIIHSQDQVYA